MADLNKSNMKCELCEDGGVRESVRVSVCGAQRHRVLEYTTTSRGRGEVSDKELKNKSV